MAHMHVRTATLCLASMTKLACAYNGQQQVCESLETRLLVHQAKTARKPPLGGLTQLSSFHGMYDTPLYLLS